MNTKVIRSMNRPVALLSIQRIQAKTVATIAGIGPTALSLQANGTNRMSKAVVDSVVKAAAIQGLSEGEADRLAADVKAAADEEWQAKHPGMEL